MTIPNTARKAGPLLGTGSQTAWPFTFKVFTQSDVAVSVTNALGVVTVLALGTDYTVTLNSNQDTSPGGTVNYPISGAALPVGSKLAIIGDLDYDQALDLPSGGNFSPLALENQLDRATMQIQQLKELSDRSARMSVFSSPEDVEALTSGIIALAAVDEDIAALSGSAADIATVADSVGSVNTVADSIGAVNSVADNLSLWRDVTAGNDIQITNFNGTGSQTAFTLPFSPGVENNTQVFIGGVYQQKNTYSLSGTTLTFGVAPPSGTANIEVVWSRPFVLGATDAGLVSFAPAGTGAVVRTSQDKMRESVSVKDFGAVGDGVTDDTAAIQAAITYCKTLVCPNLTINQGTFFISSTLVFDLPNYSTMDFIGSIVTAGGVPAIRIGSASANRFGYRVTGIKVSRTTIDTAGTSVGVQLRNIALSYIDIRTVTNFKDGVLVFADQANGGVSYNEIHLGQLHDNRTNLHLQANGASGGYVNENLFFGGSFNHSSGYPAVTTINILVDYDGVYRNNNNRFFSPSLEDNSLLATAAVINGDNNIIFHPRLERPTSQSTYEIQFTANSRECQLISHGFAISNSNINDLGDTNSYMTRNGQTYKAQTAASAGQAVYSGQSTATSAAKIYSAKDAGGVERAYVLGDGQFFSNTRGYFQTGIRWSSTDGSFNDHGLYVGSGSPEGVVTAGPGSFYSNKSGGSGTSLYVKQSGSGNTGWVGK